MSSSDTLKNRANKQEVEERTHSTQSLVYLKSERVCVVNEDGQSEVENYFKEGYETARKESMGSLLWENAQKRTQQNPSYWNSI